MKSSTASWKKWEQFFLNRATRALPELESPDKYAYMPKSVAKSLAVFQLGESGGGTIVEQARISQCNTHDEHYARSLQLFVEEEHRHAELLAICVRNLGGELIRKSWTAKLFVFARRLMGLRLKVLVLLAAEVVGVCYYHLIASRLPRSRIRSLLAQIVNDERSHLYFHCDFLRNHVSSGWRRMLFVAAWRTTITAAAIAVLIEHRRVLRDLNLPVIAVWRRWYSLSRFAEQIVCAERKASGNELQEMDAVSVRPPAEKFARIPQCQLIQGQ